MDSPLNSASDLTLRLTRNVPITESVGKLSSVGWGWATGRCVALGYVRGDAATVAHAGTPVTVDLWGETVGARAWDRWSAQAR